ncbi:MAG TPA: hypothetical protein VD971_02635 [Phycisphaerales bacterium]|nr:hypothetical protein [Phycisphaerales bacterium]
MRNASARSNILAGTFVLVAVALFVWVCFALADRGPGLNAQRFVVRFPLSEGAPGVQEGAPVLLGGQPVGKVVRIGFAGLDGSGPASVDARVEIKGDIPLYENAAITLERPLLGSLSTINIGSLGSPDAAPFQGASARLETGETVPARVAPGLLAQAGLRSDQLRSILANLDKTLQSISATVEASGPEARDAIAEVRALVTETRAGFKRWEAQADKILSDVAAASDRFGPMADKADALLNSANDFIGEARSIIRDNRERIERTITAVENSATRFEKEGLEELNAALRDARGAMAQASQAVEDISSLVSEQTPNVRKMLANLRLTADQLKLTAVEVRSQPWRLLHEPTTKELREQVLYDATRSYAAAASDVRAASEALSAATFDPDAPGVKEEIEARIARLAETIRTFEQAERALLDRLARETGK